MAALGCNRYCISITQIRQALTLFAALWRLPLVLSRIEVTHILEEFISKAALAAPLYGSPQSEFLLLRRDELLDYDPFDEGLYCRARLWLFMAYVVSFGSVAGSVWVLLQAYALNPTAASAWPGVAGLFQVTLILGSALTFFVSRTPAGESSGAYSQF